MVVSNGTKTTQATAQEAPNTEAAQPDNHDHCEMPGDVDDDGMPRAGKPEFFGKNAFGRVRCFRRTDGQTIEGCDRIRFRSHGTCEMVYKDDTFETLPMSLEEAEKAVRRGIWTEVNDSSAQAMPAPASNVRPVSEPEQAEIDEIADKFDLPGLRDAARAPQSHPARTYIDGLKEACNIASFFVDGEPLKKIASRIAEAAQLASEPPEGQGAPAAPCPLFTTWDGDEIHYGSVICPNTSPDSQWIAGECIDGTLLLQHLHTDARMRLSREACAKQWAIAVHRATPTTTDPVDISQLIFSALDERTVPKVKIRELVTRLLRCCV